MIIVDGKAFDRAKENNPHANYFIYFRADYIVAFYGYENGPDALIAKMNEYYRDLYGFVGVLLGRNGEGIYRNDGK